MAERLIEYRKLRSLLPAHFHLLIWCCFILAKSAYNQLSLRLILLGSALSVRLREMSVL